MVFLFPPSDQTEIGQEAANFATGVIADIGCVGAKNPKVLLFLYLLLERRKAK
jgi:hypothetical protein